MIGGLTLGIDIGTSGIRSAVLNAEGEVISTARALHLAQDPNRIDAMHWWTAVQSCLVAQRQALEDLGRQMTEVARIGVDGTSRSMVMTDDMLRPVTRALMYNSTGFDREAAHIADHAPEVHIVRGANSALARALHLQREAAPGGSMQLLHQADFVIAHLRGQGGVSDHNNALKLGFDPETDSYPGWFAETQVRQDALPDVVPAGTALGPIAPAIAKSLGFRSDTIVHAGTTDSIAAFLAAAPLVPGAAVTSIGTTLAVKILSPVRIDDPTIGLYSHKVGEHWLTGGASNTGGGVLASLFSPDALAHLSDQIDASSESPLDYYPLIQPGERFPINDPALAPRMTPRPTDDVAYLHGLFESIARIEAQCYAAISERGGARPTQIFTAGGGAKNATWTAIRRRVLGQEIATALHAEASVGVARLVAQMV